MKLETFFEKFELFADAPDAVARMRELIFELSTTGRLLPEELDHPVKKDTKLMGEVVELVMGQAPAGQDCNRNGHGTIFVKVGEFGPLYPREEAWTDNPLKFAKKGDVLICVVGATVGKLNLAIDCAIGRSVASIRPTSAIDTKFLFYSLFPYTLRLRRNSRGSAQGVIGKAELNAISLWVPSIAIQKRIVAKVDELMALCDQLEAQQQQREARHAALVQASLARFTQAPTPANLQFLFHPSYTVSPADLRKTILTLAVQGKLVPCETSHWKAVVMKDVCLQITDGEHATPQRVQTGVPLATAKNIRDGFLDLTNTDFVAASTAEKCWKRCKPKDQDILMVCVGATTGRVCLTHNPPDMVLVRSVALIRSNSEFIAPVFMDLFLRSPAGQSQIWGNVKQSAQPCLYLGKISQIEILLPPLAEQQRIVAKVDELMALVDELETQLAASRTVGQNLMAALVQELTTVH